MQSIKTLIRRKIRNLYLLFDYLIWLLIDPSKFRKIEKEKIKKVLIIHLGAIGELLVTTPLLSALKKNLDCEIIFMVSKGKEAIFEHNPNVDGIIAYEREFKKNVEKIKKKKFDLAVIISPASIKISFMCLLAGIKYRIGGFGGFKRGLGLFYTRKTYPISSKHTVLNNLKIIEQIGINNKKPKLEFCISEKDKKSAKLKIEKLKTKDYMVIHSGFGFVMKHKYPSRLWPLERYSKIIDYLIEKYRFDVLLTGNKEEKIFAKEIISKVKNKEKVFITNGLFNFQELAFIVSNAKLLIGPGTSIIHLATAFDTLIIELIGKEYLYEWHPWMNKTKYKVLFHPEVCTGCNLLECRKKNNECMKAITVKEVKFAIDKLMRK